MTEESLKMLNSKSYIMYFTFKHWSLCNLWIIRHAAFATCFVLTSHTSVLRIRFIFKLYATFSGILASFGLAWLLHEITFSWYGYKIKGSEM